MNREFQIINNQKGGLLLLRKDGHRYTRNKLNGNGTTLWRCVSRNVCSSSITLDKNKQRILREVDHVCVPSVFQNEILKKKENLKVAVCKDLGSVPKIVEESFSAMRRGHEDDRDLIPTFRMIKDSLYRARKKFLNTNLLTHSNLDTIVIPEAISRNFLVVEDGDQDKILVFSTNTARRIMKKGEYYFADGTFKSTPKPYYQLYVLHLDLKSDENSTNIVPVVYALLPNKTEQTYTRLFILIKQRFNIEIKAFKSDYEIAQINAVSTVFPNADISGCYHHFNDAVWKYSKKIKLNRTSEGRNVTRMAAMIPLLPANLIPAAWSHILDKSPRNDGMKRFRRYFERQWYPKFSPNILSCAGQRHRTTNSLEGWHRRINGRIPKNPNFYYFLFKLKKEAKYWDQRITDSLFKVLRNRRRLRDITFDIKYKKYLTALQNENLTIASFFKKIIFLRLSLFKK